MDANKRKRGRPRNTDDQKAAATENKRNYISQWERDNYDKALIRYPVGTLERIRATGDSINGFTVRAVLDKLQLIESHDNTSPDA